MEKFVAWNHGCLKGRCASVWLKTRKFRHPNSSSHFKQKNVDWWRKSSFMRAGELWAFDSCSFRVQSIVIYAWFKDGSKICRTKMSRIGIWYRIFLHLTPIISSHLRTGCDAFHSITRTMWQSKAVDIFQLEFHNTKCLQDKGLTQTDNRQCCKVWIKRNLVIGSHILQT